MPDDGHRRELGRAYAAWLYVCVAWGTTYLGIRIALETIPPLLMGGFRWILAGAMLIAFFRARGERLPDRREWGSLALRGTLLLGLGNGGVTWAEQSVPSGLTAVLVAVLPFWMVGVDILVGGETLNTRRIAGLIIGFLGVVLLVWPELDAEVSRHAFLGGLVATQLACLGWAIGSVAARRRQRANGDPVPHSMLDPAFEMLFGGLFLLVLGTLLNEWRDLGVTPRTGGALAYLVVFGSIGGFSAYRFALHHLSMATVSLYAYANTVIAVILGTLVLGEPFDMRLALAAAVVLLGVALVRSGPDEAERA